ncbi:MAG: branched-chain amino acid ABC transporter permease [Chthoniobacteraceae bacterium]
MMSRAKIFLLLGLVAAFVISKVPFNPYLYNIVVLVGVNIIAAVSLNLVNGYTGQFSLGHAGFMAVGAYASASVTNFAGDKILALLGGEHLYSEMILFLFALVMGGLAASLVGLLVGIPSLRLKGDYLAIVTLGFGEIIRVIIQNMEAVGAARGLSVDHQYTNLLWTYGLAAMTIYVIVCLVRSTYGLGFLSVRDDEIAAESMGINTTKFKVIAFVIGAFFAGIAGGLYAHYIQFISPSGFDFMMSVSFVVMVILGGMGNTPGVVVAAILLTLLPEGLRAFANSSLLDSLIHLGFHGWLSPTAFAATAAKTKALFSNRMIFYSLILILMMLTLPQGLFGGLRLRRKSQPA